MATESGFSFDKIMATLSEVVSAWGLKVVGALVVLVIGIIVAKVARRGVRRGLGRTKLDPTLVPFFAAFLYYTILAAVGIAVLGLFGVETTSFLAVIGTAGLALGLALQGTLSNFAAGVMLLIIRPFKVGDLIEVAGKTGKVAEIGFTTTKLDTPDNVRVLVPNSQVFGQVIQNYSSNDLRRIDLVLGISYDDDIGKAIEVAGRVLDGYDGVVKEPAPTIAVGELADSSVNLVVRPWAKADDYWKVRFELTRRLKEQIEAAGLSIPYPQHDVHLISSDSTAA